MPLCLWFVFEHVSFHVSLLSQAVFIKNIGRKLTLSVLLLGKKTIATMHTTWGLFLYGSVARVRLCGCGAFGNPDLMLWEESFWVQQCLATWQGSCKPFSVTFRNKTVDIPCHSQSSSFSWICRSSVSCLAALGHGKMCVYVPSLALVRHDTTSAFISCSPVSTKSHLQQFRHFFSRLWYICTSH